MNHALKLAIAGVSLVAANAALANNITPTTNTTGQRGSDLVLEIENTSTGQFFNYDTGVALDAVFTVAQVAAGQAANGGVPVFQTGGTGTIAYNGAGMNFGSNLSGFLSSCGANCIWSVVAADDTQTGTRTVGNNRVLVASTTDPHVPLNTTTNSTQAANVDNQFGAIQTAQAGADTNGSKGFGDSGAYSSQTMFYGTIGQGGAALGTSQYLYLIASSGNGGNPANVFSTSGTFNLSAANGFTYTPGSAVPLPAAGWLLGSGLLGLIGIGRRRRESAA